MSICIGKVYFVWCLCLFLSKRFILKELNEKARFSKYEDSFLWLRDAGVAIPAYNVEEPRVPLLLNKQRNLFKLFLNDVGLLAAMHGGNIQSRLLSPNPNINFGSVFENFVDQELYAHGFSEAQQHSLYYFNECLLYYPIYMITFFEQTQAEERVYKFDLTGL